MYLNNVITGSPVTSGELRSARDRRVLKKWEFLTSGEGLCLVEFSLNIAGSIKVFPFARMAFREESRELTDRLCILSFKVPGGIGQKISRFHRRKPPSGPPFQS